MIPFDHEGLPKIPGRHLTVAEKLIIRRGKVVLDALKGDPDAFRSQSTVQWLAHICDVSVFTVRRILGEELGADGMPPKSRAGGNLKAINERIPDLEEKVMRMVRHAAVEGNPINSPQLRRALSAEGVHVKERTLRNAMYRFGLKRGTGKRENIAKKRNAQTDFKLQYLQYRLKNRRNTREVLPIKPEVFLDESYVNVNHEQKVTWYVPGEPVTSRVKGERLCIVGAGVVYVDRAGKLCAGWVPGSFVAWRAQRHVIRKQTAERENRKRRGGQISVSGGGGGGGGGGSGGGNDGSPVPAVREESAPKRQRAERQCSKCGEKGHDRRNCGKVRDRATTKERDPHGRRQSRRCSTCNEIGHDARNHEQYMRDRETEKMKATLNGLLWPKPWTEKGVTLAPATAGHDDADDYHGNFNADLFEKWFGKVIKTCSDLYGECVFIMDGAKYHKRLVEPIPCSQWNKRQILEWLVKHSVEFPPLATKPELLQLASEHKDSKRRYVVREMAALAGHEVMYTPPYHPEFQPIENVWGIVKGVVARKPPRTMSELEAAVRFAAAHKVPGEVWIKCWKHALKEEDKALESSLNADAGDEFDPSEILDDPEGADDTADDPDIDPKCD